MCRYGIHDVPYVKLSSHPNAKHINIAVGMTIGHACQRCTLQHSVTPCGGRSKPLPYNKFRLLRVCTSLKPNVRYVEHACSSAVLYNTLSRPAAGRRGADSYTIFHFQLSTFNFPLSIFNFQFPPHHPALHA